MNDMFNSVQKHVYFDPVFPFIEEPTRYPGLDDPVPVLEFNSIGKWYVMRGRLVNEDVLLVIQIIAEREFLVFLLHGTFQLKEDIGIVPNRHL